MLAETFQAAAQYLAAFLPHDPRSLSIGAALLIVMPFLLSAVPHTMRRVRRERGY